VPESIPPASPTPAAPARPAEAKAGKPAPMTQEDFKNDPLIKQALELFKGQIVEVRA
jgi:hypothetical protein